MKALGLIETKGMIGAIEALDVACKTADVELLNRHLVKGGRVTIEIVGDVGAVKASVEAASEAVKRLGVYIGSHIIPRPAEEVYDMLKKKHSKLEEEEKEKNQIKELEIKFIENKKDKNKK
ncbi:MAG: BMC domain-containing protein [Fusobacteriaceae bacterium]